MEGCVAIGDGSCDADRQWYQDFMENLDDLTRARVAIRVSDERANKIDAWFSEASGEPANAEESERQDNLDAQKKGSTIRYSKENSKRNESLPLR